MAKHKTTGNPTRVQNGKSFPGKRSDGMGSFKGKPERTSDIGANGKSVSVKSPGLSKK